MRVPGECDQELETEEGKSLNQYICIPLLAGSIFTQSFSLPHECRLSGIVKQIPSALVE